LARLTSGRHFQARDTATLVHVCREIDQMEKHDIQSFQYRRYYDGFPWFGIAVLSALGLVQLLESTVWQRVP
jgi:hypothetical protein